MTIERKQLARESLNAALQLRAKMGKDLIGPICIYDVAEEAKLEVRFADIPSLEGMYSNFPKPAIVVGSERPVGRRVYTCAHELGHHVFGHGTRIDELRPEDEAAAPFEPEEFLAQTFAGFLLMPKLAVCNAFAERGWKPIQCNEEQAYRIANLFGVTYTGLLHHMSVSLGLIPRESAQHLMQTKLKEIRRKFISEEKRSLILVDTFWKGRPIDLEVEDLVIVPPGSSFEGSCLRGVGEQKSGKILEAVAPGHGRFTESSSGWASFVRVSRRNYAGRSIYRHLEEVNDE
jgi:Zn-dependent peptidase ImmA (M78 family)